MTNIPEPLQPLPNSTEDLIMSWSPIRDIPAKEGIWFTNTKPSIRVQTAKSTLSSLKPIPPLYSEVAISSTFWDLRKEDMLKLTRLGEVKYAEDGEVGFPLN